MNFQVEDMTNLDCWMSLIPAPALDSSGIRMDGVDPTMYLEKLVVAASKISLDIKCISCTSPQLEDLVSLLAVASAFTDLTEVLNGLLASLTNLIGGKNIQIQIDQYLNNAARKCPSSKSFSASFSSPQYDAFEYSRLPVPDDFLRKFAIVLATLFFLLAAVTVFVRRGAKRRFKDWMTSASPNDILALKTKHTSEEMREEKLNAETTSMVMSGSIPRYVRMLVPLIIIANILLFLSGHISTGAEIDVIVNVFGEPLTLSQVFSFSLAESIRDMWSSGAKGLAIFICIFSGVWPYSKQLISFVLWFAPPSRVSVSRRLNILLWLDTLGKWSFVDILVLIMSLAAFRVSVLSPALAILPQPLYSAELVVIPCWGLYANFIAQILSQISSHVIIHYCRKIVSDCVKDDQDESLVAQGTSEKRALCKHSFDKTGAKEFVTRKGVNVAIVLTAVGVVALFCCGCLFDAVSFESFGLLGIAIESGQNMEDAIVPQSFLSIITLIIAQAKFTGVTSDYIGLLALCAIFTITVFLVPLAQLGLLLWRWFVPMDKKARYRNFLAIETLSAWQYSEVFIFSVVIASWQLGTVR